MMRETRKRYKIQFSSRIFCCGGKTKPQITCFFLSLLGCWFIKHWFIDSCYIWAFWPWPALWAQIALLFWPLSLSAALPPWIIRWQRHSELWKKSTQMLWAVFHIKCILTLWPPFWASPCCWGLGNLNPSKVCFRGPCILQACLNVGPSLALEHLCPNRNLPASDN